MSEENSEGLLGEVLAKRSAAASEAEQVKDGIDALRREVDSTIRWYGRSLERAGNASLRAQLVRVIDAPAGSMSPPEGRRRFRRTRAVVETTRSKEVPEGEAWLILGVQPAILSTSEYGAGSYSGSETTYVYALDAVVLLDDASLWLARTAQTRSTKKRPSNQYGRPAVTADALFRGPLVRTAAADLDRILRAFTWESIDASNRHADWAGSGHDYTQRNTLDELNKVRATAKSLVELLHDQLASVGAPWAE